jgi:hypothetical protein
MFRIVQFKVDRKKLVEVAESRRTTVSALQNYVDLQSDGKHFITEPMATTERKYFDAEQCLRSLFGDRIHWDVVDNTSKFKLFRTRAPQAYDYGYVVEVGTMPGETERDTERLVAIPTERVEYQSGRYSSGMFTPIDCS